MTEPGTHSRYVMIGGFLGAGKTTAVLRAARTLTDRGLRVGLITNDQSTGLVDTAMLRSHGFAVEEIAGGCFCCRFPSLQEAAGRLDESTRPDVFLAEPVGSCTDLVATVSYRCAASTEIASRSPRSRSWWTRPGPPESSASWKARRSPRT